MYWIAVKEFFSDMDVNFEYGKQKENLICYILFIEKAFDSLWFLQLV